MRSLVRKLLHVPGRWKSATQDQASGRLDPSISLSGQRVVMKRVGRGEPKQEPRCLRGWLRTTTPAIEAAGVVLMFHQTSPPPSNRPASRPASRRLNPATLPAIYWGFSPQAMSSYRHRPGRVGRAMTASKSRGNYCIPGPKQASAANDLLLSPVTGRGQRRTYAPVPPESRLAEGCALTGLAHVAGHSVATSEGTSR